jgi:hypothetical protein
MEMYRCGVCFMLQNDIKRLAGYVLVGLPSAICWTLSVCVNMIDPTYIAALKRI